MDERDTANQTHTARESAIPTRVTQGDDPAGRARPPEGSAEPPTRKGIRIQWPALETGERQRLRDGTQGLPEVDVARLGEALTELWGEPVRVVGGSVRAADPSSRNTKLGESQASLTEPNEWRLGRIGVVLEDRQRGGTVVVELDPSLAAHALGQILGVGMVPSTGWLTDGERGILLYLAARLLRSTGAVGWAVRAVTTTLTPDAPPLADKPLGRPYRLECPSGPFRADLWFDGTVARRERRRVLPPETAIPCPVVAARGHLPAGKLQPAAAGDVLLLDDVFLEGANDTFRATARLCAGDHEWPCEIREGRVHLLDVPTTAPPQGNPTMRTIPEENTSLEEIPVQVTVELAQVPMTLGDLERLGPGDVIDTEVPIDATAVVRAGGVYFGRAEIVDLEGRIGFRLVDRAPPPPAR